MINKNKILQSTSWLYLNFLISSAINFLIAILIVKNLSVNDYALFGVYSSIFLFIALISYIGIPNYIQRYFPDYLLNNPSKISIAFNTTTYFRLIIQFLLIIIFYVLVKLNVIPKVDYIDLYLISTFYVFIIGRTIIINSEEALNALGEQKKIFVFRIISNLVKISIFGYSLLFTKVTLGSIFLAFGISEFVFTLFSVYFINKNFGSGLKDFKITLSIFSKEEISYARYNYLTQIQNIFLNGSIDTLVIASFLGKEVLAYFVFATVFSANLIKFIPVDPLYRGMMPSLIQDYTKSNSTENITKSIKLFNQIILIVYLPIIIILSFNIEQIIILFGKNEYLDAKYLLIGFLFIKFISLFANPLKMGLVVLKKAKELFYSNLFFILVPLLMIIAVMYLDVYGALLSSFIVIVLIIIFRHYYLFKYIKKNYLDSSLLQIILVFGVLSIPYYYLLSVFGSLYVVVILSFLYGIVSIIILFLLKLIPSEIQLYVSKFRKKILVK